LPHTLVGLLRLHAPRSKEPQDREEPHGTMGGSARAHERKSMLERSKGGVSR
jgi:hypothetical protein